jgi:hypothetical protein
MDIGSQSIFIFSIQKAAYFSYFFDVIFALIGLHILPKNLLNFLQTQGAYWQF